MWVVVAILLLESGGPKGVRQVWSQHFHTEEAAHAAAVFLREYHGPLIAVRVIQDK